MIDVLTDLVLALLPLLLVVHYSHKVLEQTDFLNTKLLQQLRRKVLTHC